MIFSTKFFLKIVTLLAREWHFCSFAFWIFFFNRDAAGRVVALLFFFRFGFFFKIVTLGRVVALLFFFRFGFFLCSREKVRKREKRREGEGERERGRGREKPFHI